MTQTAPLDRYLRPRGRLLAQDSRRYHRSLVLQTLRRGGPASRADLARATGLTRVTVSDLVGRLVAAGLVHELGTPIESRVGKPPTLVDIAAEATQIVAIDLSSEDRFVGAVTDLAGRIVARAERKRDGRIGPHASLLVQELADDLIGRATRPVLGIGVGSPGLIDSQAGVVMEAANLGWLGEDLAADLHARTGLSVFVGNDANVAALGEHSCVESDGGGMMVVRIGAGVGAGLILDGALFQGHRGAAGEVGHVVVDPLGERCACGRLGCLETIISERRLRVRLADAAEPDRVLTDAGRMLGIALAPVVATLDLRELVLAGPDDLLNGALSDAVRDAVAERTLPGTDEDLVVRMSDLGSDGILIGASVLVLAGELGVS